MGEMGRQSPNVAASSAHRCRLETSSARRSRRAGAIALLALIALAPEPCLGAGVRGANSWYSLFGASNETQALAAAQFMSERMLSYGYDTYCIDEGWAEDASGLLLDAYGRPTWDAKKYPTGGIPGLAARMQALGIKLGVWLIRGVPRAAAAQRLPIFGGGGATADQAARNDRNCSWSSTCAGSNAPSVAASAYYASVAAQIKSWGVALVKIDCLWPHLYEGTPQVYFNEDVEAMTAAFSAAGLELSLSPGISVSPQNGSYIAAGRRAGFYRIAEDVLDVYDGQPDGTFPQGLHQKLTKALEFEALLDTNGGNGTTPDFDMLMLGRTIHSYGGAGSAFPPTETHLTPTEQLQAVTLFSFVGVPLIVGGFLPLDDDANGTATLALLTNAEVLLVQNESLARASFVPPEAGGGGPELYGWRTTPSGAQSPSATRYVALFAGDIAGAQQAASARFEADLGLPAGTESVCLRDLWSHSFVQPVGGPLPGGAVGFTAEVARHGARAFLVAPLGSADCEQGLAGATLAEARADERRADEGAAEAAGGHAAAGLAAAPYVIDFLPAPAASGFRNASMWSWGGGVVGPTADGLYHLFGSAFSGGCGLSCWGSNSFAHHSTSTSPLGPFAFAGRALPYYSHNVQPIVAPDGTVLIFKIGMFPEPQPSLLGGGEAAAAAAGAAAAAADAADGPPLQHGFETIECWYSSSVDGPFEPVLNAAGGANGRNLFNSTNPAPAFDPSGNGTIYVMGHNSGSMVVSIAPSWRGPYSAPVPVFSFLEDDYVGEDPVLWFDRTELVWRCLYHMYNKSDTKHQFRLGGYAQSTGADLFSPWVVQPDESPAYTADFEQYVSGNSGPTQTTTLSRRERPKVYLDPTSGEPAVLYNGVCPPTSSSDCFTTAAPIAPAAAGARRRS